MTEARPRRDRTRAPIALQVVALLVVSLIAAQVITFLVVVLTPPPVRAAYRLEEVATALKGGSINPGFGRPLVRSVHADAPSDERTDRRFPSDRSRRRLAELLGAPEANVRLIRHAPLGTMLIRRPFGAIGMARVPDGPPPGEGVGGPGGRGPGGPPPGGERGFNGGSGPGQGAFYMPEGERPLFGDFTAAVRRASGDWVVVEPQPEPFPNDWQGRVLIWFAGCLLLVAPLGYMFARRITAPLGAFAKAAEALGRDPSVPLMPLRGPAEIGMAARAFNDMQVRLKRYIDDRTAMVGAISHDLRTPLARIRFKIEAAPPELKGPVLADIAQMEQMITAVLSFIRDASTSRPRERLDLRSLVECAVDEAALTGQPAELSAGPALTVEADALGLQRLFTNLLDNAVKYGGGARVTLSEADGEAVISISDDGPGLPSADLERVFEPFYRAELARTLDGSGVGLGLAVARSIARAHGGDVTLISSAAGLTAKVRLPLSNG
jgi:two-component system OmpR family sensor kinase